MCGASDASLLKCRMGSRSSKATLKSISYTRSSSMHYPIYPSYSNYFTLLIINYNTLSISLLSILILRILGTPNESIWPGISQLPDWRARFPQWKPKNLAAICPYLSPAGVDLLSVCSYLLPLCTAFFILFCLLANASVRSSQTYYR